MDKDFDDFLGGAPANVACGLSKLGVDAAFLGSLGNDSIGKEFCDLFTSLGINISGIQLNNEFPTRIVLVHRDIKGERSFGGFVGGECQDFADQNLDLDDLKKTLPLVLHQSSWLLLGTIPMA